MDFIKEIKDFKDLIPGFFRQIQDKIQDFSKDSIESLIELYIQILRLKEKIKKTRDFSIKVLRKLLRFRGFSLNSQYFSKKSLKFLIFLIDFLIFHFKTDPKSLKDLPNLIEYLQSLEKSPIIDLFLIEINEIATLNSSKSQDFSIISLELNLIPIIIYFALIKGGFPVFMREIRDWLKKGWIPYLMKNNSQSLDFSIAQNIPSLSFLRKKAEKFYEKMKKKLGISVESLDFSLSKRVLEEIGLPMDIFHGIYLEIIRKFGLFASSKGISEIALCSGLIFLLKLIYGLNNEAYCSLLKNEDLDLLTNYNQENLQKAIEIRELFKKTNISLRFLEKIPDLDSILTKMKKIIKEINTKSNEIVENNDFSLENFNDLKTAKLEDFGFLEDCLENQDFSDLSSKNLDFSEGKSSKQIDKITFLSNEIPKSPSFQEKGQISHFLIEELDFLAKIDHSNLKSTVFPLPSSRFFIRTGFPQENKQEFCLILDFFAIFLEENPNEILGELRKIEKSAISNKI